jgi:5,10-methenyltetrahydrofolate synthetase
VPLLTEVSAAKQASRARQRARLARLAPDERRARSANLVAHLVQLPVWQAARRVLLFAPLAGEPDLDLLWLGPGLAGKQCAYPRATGHGQMHLRVVRRLEELQPTRWGLREPPLEGADPVTLEDLDLVLVPGLAFDEKAPGWVAAVDSMTACWPQDPQRPGPWAWLLPFRSRRSCRASRTMCPWMRCSPMPACDFHCSLR